MVAGKVPRLLTDKYKSVNQIIDYLLQKNEYLQNVENLSDKINLIHDKPAAGNTVHYILKCSSDIRAMIQNNGNIVCLK